MATEQSTRSWTHSDVTSLVAAAADGDRAAWDGLVDRFGELVWAVARSHRLSHADAADVSQTTWLRLLEHLGSIRQPDRVGAWLATTARRESLRVLKVGRRQTPAVDEVFDEDAMDPAGAVDVDVLRSERDAALWAAFVRLPSRCQAMLRLLMGESALRYRDLSDTLDMPIGSIGPTRARCLEHLRRLIEESSAIVDLPAAERKVRQENRT